MPAVVWFLRSDVPVFDDFVVFLAENADDASEVHCCVARAIVPLRHMNGLPDIADAERNPVDDRRQTPSVAALAGNLKRRQVARLQASAQDVRRRAAIPRQALNPADHVGERRDLFVGQCENEHSRTPAGGGQPSAHILFRDAEFVGDDARRIATAKRQQAFQKMRRTCRTGAHGLALWHGLDSRSDSTLPSSGAFSGNAVRRRSGRA